ncbi:histone deacetylase family protein [Methylomarinum vadi]|uniref:histone deacetylase family protein n=1 Tax=Methylomarinum vadi TaxID=438855 RepID=UPI0004DF8532|nr:histone deacetylase family protein [Methylomarinum vadi]
MTTLYFYHDDFLRHDTGEFHPESSARLTSINSALNTPAFDRLTRMTPVLLDDIEEHIALIHTADYIQTIHRTTPRHGQASLDADTVLSPGSYQAALLAASAVCGALDRVVAKQADNAFCAVRPPGHHAEESHAMGFCLFNNIAVAAAYARKFHGVDRLAIVDFDVHHGNGTQQAFYRTAEVMYASSHQMPLFPGTGHPSETGVGNIVNVPLSAGDTGIQFREKYRNIILPALRKFKPELILLSAGFDAHKADPLASIMLESEDFHWVTRQVMEIAATCCSGRIISVLEGGYDLPALGESAAAHVSALMNSQ